MPALTVDERTHQRVLDFLTRRPEKQTGVDDTGERDFIMHAPDAPLSIAEQTAADLVRFLRSAG